MSADVITVGSLFSGYEGIGLGLSAAGIEHRHLWVADNNPAAAKVLAARLPGVPNLKDVTKVDWRALAVPDLLTGGFPCTDVSLAGQGRGIAEGTRSGLWLVMADAIRIMRPRWVLIENVRGLLSARADCDVEPCPWCLGDRGGPDQEPVLRALGAVLGDLSDLGYDTSWVTVAASDIGAAHQRERVFVLAYWPGDFPQDQICGPAARSRWGGGVDALLTPLLPTLRASDTGTEGRRASEGFRPPLSQVVFELMPTARTSDTSGAGVHGQGGMDLRTAVSLLPTTTAANAYGNTYNNQGALLLPGVAQLVTSTGRWDKYGPAIERWEHIIGRPAPEPTVAGERGSRVLSPHFDEWFMGLPEGWLTDLLRRPEVVAACGNGVVPQQLAYGLARMPVSA